MEAFLLGLSNGTVCLAYCAPVMVPYLWGEGQGIVRNLLLLGQFLLGRLLGYLLFAVLAGLLGLLLPARAGWREALFGLAYMVLALLLAGWGFLHLRGRCAAEAPSTWLERLFSGPSPFLPALLGFLTGLNLCPPFLLAFTGASASGGIGGSIHFFLLFFLGTAVFFLPLPFLGLLRSIPPLRTVGQLAALLVGAYYFYVGLILFAGGVGQL